MSIPDVFGTKKPQMAATPAPPTVSKVNTSAAVEEQSRSAAGRAATESAGASGPVLQDSTDPYSVKKKLLGATA